MPTDEFLLIKEAMDDVSTTTPSWALHARFVSDDPMDDPRKFLAYVLGGDQPGPSGAEAVLVWQYAGPHTFPSDPKRNWRCFKVGDLRHPTNPASATQIEKIKLLSTDPPPPPHLTNKEIARQNCVPGKIGNGSGGRAERSVDYHP
jgi:hypothetical protein